MRRNRYESRSIVSSEEDVDRFFERIGNTSEEMKKGTKEFVKSQNGRKLRLEPYSMAIGIPTGWTHVHDDQTNERLTIIEDPEHID